MTMNYSKYQRSIFAFVKGESGYTEAGDGPVEWDQPLPEDYTVDFGGKRNAVVEAVAGSGKTTTIVKALDFLAANKPLSAAELAAVMRERAMFGNTATLTTTANQPRVLFVAFNKHIAEELQRRVPSYVQASTLNSFGWGICRANVRGVDIDKNKDENILRTFLSTDDEDQRKVFYKVKGPVTKMVGLLKALLITDRAVIAARFNEISDQYDVTIPEVRDFPFDFRQTVLDVWQMSVDCVRFLSYDDQVFQPIYQDWEIPTFSFIFGDEVQDWSAMQVELVRRAARNGRAVLVGDRHQCQPVGTMVDVVARRAGPYQTAVVERRPIETLKKYDTVVSFDIRYNNWKRCDSIQAVASRPYVGDLIRITTRTGLTSRCTPNHKCVVNFDGLQDRFCVYLMRRGNQFRIGKARMCYGAGGCGPGSRLRQETAVALWVLCLCDSDVEAFVEEQVIAANFGLPQLTFVTNTGRNFPQDEIDYVWNRIGDNVDRAIKCLDAYYYFVN